MKQSLDYEFIARGYDLMATMTSDEGEGGAFHLGYFEDPKMAYTDAMRTMVYRAGQSFQKYGSKRVLDVGCGLGHSLYQVCDRYGLVGVGVDISRKSIAGAEDIYFEHVQSSKLTFQFMDGHNLLFREGVFDGIIAIESLYHMDKQQAIDEMYRVLRPGGVVSVCDYHAKEGWVEPIHSGHSSNVELEVFLKMFEKAGFSKVQFTDWSEKVRPSFEHHKKRKMSPQTKEAWLEFCDNAPKISGYGHFEAVK